LSFKFIVHTDKLAIEYRHASSITVSANRSHVHEWKYVTFLTIIDCKISR